MLTGKRDKNPGFFRFRLLLLNRANGFTIPEALLTILLVSILLGALFYTLSVGEFTGFFSSSKVDLQAEVRRTIDWITKDVRQAVSWELADTNNNPSGTHIKFRKAQGWDTVNDTFLLSNDYTEYTYNADSNTMTRRLSDAGNNTIQVWNLNNIVQSPFYTRDSSGNIVPLNSGDLLTSRRLIIVIAGQQHVRAGHSVSSSLTGEVKIRNE